MQDTKAIKVLVFCSFIQAYKIYSHNLKIIQGMLFMMNNYSGNGMGVYTAASQFDFNPAKLKQLGFQDIEIQCLQNVMYSFGKVTMQQLQMGAGLNYEQAQRIMYMYNICTGRVRINSEQELIQHLRKMFGKQKRININDLPTQPIQSIPRTAMVAGIKEQGYTIWNSKNYPIMERAYKVVDVSGGYITIETDRWPTLKYKQARKVPGVLEIKEIDKENQRLVVQIHKDYCRLCNRFVIVAQTRRPEFHLGLVQIICLEGTKIYVYAQNAGTKEKIHYTSGNSRVYDYGYYAQDIKQKLMSTAQKIYKMVCGFTAQVIKPNQRFEYLQKDEPAQDVDTGYSDGNDYSSVEYQGDSQSNSQTQGQIGDMDW